MSDIRPQAYWVRLRQRLSQPYETLNKIEISAAAVLHNYDLIGSQHPGMAVMPVLKANAYGHGLLQVGEILQQRKFPYLIVDGYFEALKLRRLTRQPILVMGYINPVNYAQLKTEGLAFVVHDRECIEALGARRQPTSIHLEINTGMNRQGIEPSELSDYLDLIDRLPNLRLEGVMSHLADADGESEDYTETQIELFDNCVDRVLGHGFKPALIHLAQTAGSVRRQSRHANAIRLGIGLYGVNPFDISSTQFERLADLRPALKLTSTITKVIDLKAGQKVSYNGIFTAKHATRIGVLPLGYYEGIPRDLSNKGRVKIGADYAPIAGRVCMNHTMIDLKDLPAQYLDPVVVISDNPTDHNSVAGFGRDHGLFSYEVLVGLSESIRRVIA